MGRDASRNRFHPAWPHTGRRLPRGAPCPCRAQEGQRGRTVMSADVVPFPERQYHPDFDAIGTLLEKAEETREFFELAELAFGTIAAMRLKKRPTPADLTAAEVQTIANSLAVAF